MILTATSEIGMPIICAKYRKKYIFQNSFILFYNLTLRLSGAGHEQNREAPALAHRVRLEPVVRHDYLFLFDIVRCTAQMEVPFRLRIFAHRLCRR